MADSSQVAAALVTLITQIVYPSGTGSPSAVGTPVKIYRGWPIPAALNADLAAGISNVSVFPRDDETRVTRHLGRWFDLPFTPATLTLTATNTTVTVSGTVSSPQNAAALVNGTKAYVYAVQPGDTPNSIATGLAALINADTPATSSGAVVTVAGAKKLVARVGAVGTAVKETKRQKRGFQITCWCPTPAARDALASLIDAALSDIGSVALPDGTGGRLLYLKSVEGDGAERDGIYRRDLFYQVEYSTTKSQAVAQIVAELLSVSKVSDLTPAPITTVTTTTAI